MPPSFLEELFWNGSTDTLGWVEMTNRDGIVTERRGGRVESYLLISLFLAVFSYSWVTDDAFFSFRVVDQISLGNGPVFNQGERVQVFTHPLWLFLLLPASWLGIHPYFWSILVGLVCTGCTLVIIGDYVRTASRRSIELLGIVLFLITETVLTFQTSGLENSLLSFLLVIAVLALGHLVQVQDLFKFTFALSLMLLTRLDHLFIVLPLLVWALWVAPGKTRSKVFALHLGLLPLVIWEGFSLIYYGTPFPNTKYVKIGGRSFSEALDAGITYYFDFLSYEPLQALSIILVPLYCLLICLRRSPSSIEVPLGVGILAQVAYVIFEGGDFMRGRFFHSAIWGTALLILLVITKLESSLRHSYRYVYIGLLSLGLLYGRVALLSFSSGTTNGIINERLYYQEYLALSLTDPFRFKRHPFVEAAEIVLSKHHGQGALISSFGQKTFALGPTINTFDLFGLSDAFIARCPVADNRRTGHFTRRIPREYLQYRFTGDTPADWQNKKLQELHKNLLLVTTSPELLSKARFKAILWVWSNYGI